MAELQSMIQKSSIFSVCEAKTKFNRYGRQVYLFCAKDGRHYIRIISKVVGEPLSWCEWLSRHDYVNVWLPALKKYWSLLQD
jgi:hypothetical protein